MTQQTVSISTLKPFGRLASMLEKFDDAITEVEKQGYSKEVSRLLKLIVEFGLVDDDFWHKEAEAIDVDMREEYEKETANMLWLGHLYVIRLNNIGQKHHNNIDMEPNHIQLANNPDIKKYYPQVTFVA